MGFPNEIVDTIKLVTFNKETPYLDYIRLIKNNPIARQVKISDLKHNSDLSRYDTITEKDLQ